MSDITDRLFGLNLAKMSESRKDILTRFAGGEPTKNDNDMLTRAISAIRSTVASRERTEIRGLGVFTWKPFHTHLPDGTSIDTHRLWFSSACIRKGRRK